MNSSELRKRFLKFFQARGHTVVPGDSLVPAGDPTLLFTGAGMNQFKEYFLGVRKEIKRAASCQKCFRTQDVDQVGKTPSHLTFFEMLGNFSFGDYFKPEAIRFALDFLTVELKISPDRLWASVYEKDEEAFRIWTQSLNYPPERVIRFGEKENFWPSNAPTDGPDGPCGPCSEIYFDYERCLVGKVCPDPDHCAPGCPCGRFVEIWNLVFTQFDRLSLSEAPPPGGTFLDKNEGEATPGASAHRLSDGTLVPLPQKNIDTGMGLERLTAVMQNKMSVFETDLFEPIIEAVVHLLREDAPEVLRPDQRSFIYAIVDHVRALTFLVAEGVVPSNEGRGYVVRMLLRKAERAGAALGVKKPFLYQLVPVVAKIMESGYPELTQRRESIAKTILTEEERFKQTLEEKLPLLEETIHSGRVFSASQAARFYDTHGLSYEEITVVCQKENVKPPSREDFDKALAALQAKSKASSAFSGDIFAKDDLKELLAPFKPATEFVGYQELSTTARVRGLIQENHLVDEVKAPAAVQVILDRSPFYAEAGGQVGDAGTLEAAQGKGKVLDTQWVGSLILHRAQLIEGRVKVNDSVKATVDLQRRRKVAQNHTGTHLLHAALRKVLGSHVVQAGSLVASEKIRFDFSHSSALSSSQRDSVEHLVSEWIEKDLSVSVNEMPFEEAKRRGALALFGEKYAAQVRVVSIGEISMELCGGTHLPSSSDVRLLTIVEEGSVASGIRRVEALTGHVALSYFKRESKQLKELARQLKTRSESVGQAVAGMMKQTRQLVEELTRLKVRNAQAEAKNLSGQPVAGFTLFVQQINEPMDHTRLRLLADAIRQREPEAVIFLADSEGFCVATSGNAAQAKGISADQILKLSTQIAGGSGGGRPDLAQGRLKEPSKFPEVCQQLKNYIQEQLNLKGSDPFRTKLC